MKLLSPTSILHFSLITILPLCTALYPTKQIYQFPNGTFVENLAVRSDGFILTSLITSPELYLIQPSAKRPNPQLVYHFDNSTSVLGITEVSLDTFIVAVTTIKDPRTAQGAPGSSSLWRVAFSKAKSKKATVTFFTRIPDVVTPNGLVTLNKHKILLGDSAQGTVFAVDLDKGVSEIAIKDPLFTNNGRPIGLNGLKILGKTLYFTNSAQNILGRVEIDLKTGAALGPASKVVSALSPGGGYSDFALSQKDIAFVTNGGNFVERVDLNSLQQVVIAGQVNSTEIRQPTAAAFGRNGKEDILFVTTGGGLLGPPTGVEVVGGQVVAIMLGMRY